MIKLNENSNDGTKDGTKSGTSSALMQKKLLEGFMK